MCLLCQTARWYRVERTVRSYGVRECGRRYYGGALAGAKQVSSMPGLEQPQRQWQRQWRERIAHGDGGGSGRGVDGDVRNEKGQKLIAMGSQRLRRRLYCERNGAGVFSAAGGGGGVWSLGWNAPYTGYKISHGMDMGVSKAGNAGSGASRGASFQNRLFSTRARLNEGERVPDMPDEEPSITPYNTKGPRRRRGRVTVHGTVEHDHIDSIGAESQPTNTSNTASAGEEAHLEEDGLEDMEEADVKTMCDNAAAALAEQLEIIEDQPEGPVQDLKPSDLEALVRAIRQTYGESLPEGILDEKGYALYERLFGAPVRTYSENAVGSASGNNEKRIGQGEEGGEELVDDEQAPENALYKTSEDGELEEVVRYDEEIEEEVDEVEEEGEEVESSSYDNDADTGHESRKKPYDHTARTHPLTAAGRFRTDPSTVQLNKQTMTTPVSDMIADVSMKHLSEVAHETFGGIGLPHSASTPVRTKHHFKQLPNALDAGQRNMSDREGDLFMAVMWPALYASVTSVLTEVRKRLGSEWLEGLMQGGSSAAKKDETGSDAERNDTDGDGENVAGPRILDVGTGGAAVFAFREALQAEWERMHESSSSSSTSSSTNSSSASPEASASTTIPPAPIGKASVLTGSDSLRHRASRLLSDTTFLPRLPDTVPDATTEPELNVKQPRKRYDLIVAAHTIWPLQEDWMRKRQVEKLWSLLNPDGGVLLVIEKGVPRGFEAVAGARQFLLDRCVASPGSESYERVVTAVGKEGEKKMEEGKKMDGGEKKGNGTVDGRATDADVASSSEVGSSTADGSSSSSSSTATSSAKSGFPRFVKKETGMIIAPCTNHETCPMYASQGINVVGRKDICHFSQRYFRPSYLQRIIGARSKNFEDVKFSYVAVQRGKDRRFVTQNGVDGENINGDTARNNGSSSSKGRRPMILQRDAATNAAFRGYDTEDSTAPSSKAATASTASTEKPEPSPIPPKLYLTLPRSILPPIKAQGHIMLDVCTPSGCIERWTVPKSYNRHAYRDARKSRWGDLWALGAKTRVRRVVRGGKKAEELVRTFLGRKKSRKGEVAPLRRRAAIADDGSDGTELIGSESVGGIGDEGDGGGGGAGAGRRSGGGKNKRGSKKDSKDSKSTSSSTSSTSSSSPALSSSKAVRDPNNPNVEEMQEQLREMFSDEDFRELMEKKSRKDRWKERRSIKAAAKREQRQAERERRRKKREESAGANVGGGSEGESGSGGKEKERKVEGKGKEKKKKRERAWKRPGGAGGREE